MEDGKEVGEADVEVEAEDGEIKEVEVGEESVICQCLLQH